MVISKKPLHVIVAIALAILPLFSFANVFNDSVKEESHEVHATAAETHHEAAAEPQDKKVKVDAYIQHHLQDSYDFTFFSDEKEGKHYGFSLPVILIDNGLVQKKDLVKILGRGELKSKLTISADAYSDTAKLAIEKAGGSANLTENIE